MLKFRLVEDSSDGEIDIIEAKTREDALNQVLESMGYRVTEIEDNENIFPETKDNPAEIPDYRSMIPDDDI
jgi:hypothetical protein